MNFRPSDFPTQNINQQSTRLNPFWIPMVGSLPFSRGAEYYYDQKNAIRGFRPANHFMFSDISICFRKGHRFFSRMPSQRQQLAHLPLEYVVHAVAALMIHSFRFHYMESPWDQKMRVLNSFQRAQIVQKQNLLTPRNSSSQKRISLCRNFNVNSHEISKTDFSFEKTVSAFKSEWRVGWTCVGVQSNGWVQILVPIKNRDHSSVDISVYGSVLGEAFRSFSGYVFAIGTSKNPPSNSIYPFFKMILCSVGTMF